jgi:DtxR family transcriptional regulator, Mn-dependent transcriptional regulator
MATVFSDPPEHLETELDTSESEEMYLITAARAVEDGIDEPVPLARLADDLGISAVSANQMVKKLAGRGLVDYVPYQGVSLTDEGWRIARSILRRRRLWGVFLCRHLGLSPDRADGVACDMEHITPDDVAERLADFLDHPAVGPTGRPIPGGSATPPSPTHPLTTSVVGEDRVVAALQAPDVAVAFFESLGLGPGAIVRIDAVAADGSLLVTVADDRVRLSAEAGDWIRVEPPR